jgi:hypothetical protein
LFGAINSWKPDLHDFNGRGDEFFNQNEKFYYHPLNCDKDLLSFLNALLYILISLVLERIFHFTGQDSPLFPDTAADSGLMIA